MEKLQELLEALNLSKETGEKKAQQKSFTDLGDACYDLGQNEKSVEYFEKGLHVSEEIGDKEEEGKTCNKIGIAYIALGSHEKAIEYLEKSLSDRKSVV